MQDPASGPNMIPAAAVRRIADQARRMTEPGAFLAPSDSPPVVIELVTALNDLLERVQQEQTALAAANTALAQSRDAAEAASLAKSTFLANMSHELRTPLNAMLGFTEMMVTGLYGPLTEEQQSRLTRVLVNGQNLLSLLNEVLDMARIEAGKVQLLAIEIEPGVLLRSIAGSIEPEIKRKALDLQVEVQPGLPVIRTDVDRLRQVLGNLVNNALQFTDTGAITLRAQSAPQWPQAVRFTVADTGIGIPATALPHIWDEFYQVGGGIRRPAGGAGLGLAISRKLTRLLGGQISVESEEHHGSRFHVDLPLRPGATGPLGNPPGLPPDPA
ncbi:MAG TPA: ATP-binding protein [Chloroflexia bacterium]|nr:ATP-binding protein [Chloroflexia bacterium]